MKIKLELATFPLIKYVSCARYQLVSLVLTVVVERHGGGGVVVALS